MVNGIKVNLDEKIEFEEYNSKWKDCYEEEKNKIEEKLGDRISGIEHNGSTAVPGMSAKPIIDILIGVTDLDKFSEIEKDLESLGYENCGKISSVRYYLRKRGERKYNLAVVKYKEKEWNRYVDFRDYLIEYPEEAKMYAEHKRNIINNGTNNLLEYNKLKKDYIVDLYKRVNEWSIKQ